VLPWLVMIVIEGAFYKEQVHGLSIDFTRMCNYSLFTILEYDNFFPVKQFGQALDETSNALTGDTSGCQHKQTVLIDCM
jgi:hypothetical protein